MSAAIRFGASDVERCVPIEGELQGRGIVLERQGAELVEPCPVCEHCSICNCAPCGTPGFCQMCREVARPQRSAGASTIYHRAGRTCH
jgi:hypothetical protein